MRHYLVLARRAEIESQETKEPKRVPNLRNCGPIAPCAPRTIFHHTMRNESTKVQRRSRVKLMGEVMPSPVGLAMVKEV